MHQFIFSWERKLESTHTRLVYISINIYITHRDLHKSASRRLCVCFVRTTEVYPCSVQTGVPSSVYERGMFELISIQSTGICACKADSKYRFVCLQPVIKQRRWDRVCWLLPWRGAARMGLCILSWPSSAMPIDHSLPHRCPTLSKHCIEPSLARMDHTLLL